MSAMWVADAPGRTARIEKLLVGPVDIGLARRCCPDYGGLRTIPLFDTMAVERALRQMAKPRDWWHEHRKPGVNRARRGVGPAVTILRGAAPARTASASSARPRLNEYPARPGNRM
jgi:hypothetical protein